jgi:hypothetical protein
MKWNLDSLTNLRPDFFFLFFFFGVLGLELRAYTLSQPPALFVLGIFEIGSQELFAWLASNHDPSDLCLLSS